MIHVSIRTKIPEALTNVSG